MDKIIIPASITLEKSISVRKYKWKNREKFSHYKSSSRRAVIRFSSKNFSERVRKLNINKRQVFITFVNNSKISLNRINEKSTTIQGYNGNHPYIQIVINKSLPEILWERLYNIDKKTVTFPVEVELNLNDWEDIKLSPSDFLLEVEKESKLLMTKALLNNFTFSRSSKGREYDLLITNPNKKDLMIAISSHTAKNKSRSKEKTVQKILMDIGKMLPSLHKNKGIIPVIITRPIEFERSWSFTTKKYLDFYRDEFGFKFLTTEFKKGWEDNIIKELSQI